MDTAVWLSSGYWLGAIVWVAMFSACTFIIIDTHTVFSMSEAILYRKGW